MSVENKKRGTRLTCGDAFVCIGIFSFVYASFALQEIPTEEKGGNFEENSMKSMGKMGSSSSSNTKTATKIGVKSDEKSVRILCVGDSLTEGYYQGGRHFSPYTDTLEKLLKNEYSETKWEVVNYGISGFEGVQCISWPYPTYTRHV
mmetsp:Transcript_9063/g.16613  ORF Transcript_9063/g.16613 Transcript_9063/m.16613 type:complete len:147 (+) Transcript_9063:34-474(+)